MLTKVSITKKMGKGGAFLLAHYDGHTFLTRGIVAPILQVKKKKILSVFIYPNTQLSGVNI